MINKFFENIFKKKVKIFKIELYLFNLILIILVSGLAIMNLVGFINALISSSFIVAVVDTILFAWNSGLVYWLYLSDTLVEFMLKKN